MGGVGGGGGGGRRRIGAGQWGRGGVLGPRWSVVRVRRRRPAARGRGTRGLFAAGTSGWVEFCALRPRVEVGVGVAWFGSFGACDPAAGLH